MEFETLDRFSKNTQISNFMTTLLVGAEVLHAADGRTDKQIEITRPIITFPNFANAPEKQNESARGEIAWSALGRVLLLLL
jgi:hypothetical protein